MTVFFAVFFSSSYFRFVMEVRGLMHTSILTYLLPYFRTYHKVAKPEIAFSSETGSKADIRNSSTLLHVESITDHFNTQLSPDKKKGMFTPGATLRWSPVVLSFYANSNGISRFSSKKFPKHFNSDLSMESDPPLKST